MELVPGLMLFSRRTYYFGAILLLPVIGQVFLLNLFFKIGGLTFPVSVVLLMCNALILYSQKKEILAFLQPLNCTQTAARSLTENRIALLGRVLIVGFSVFVILKSTYSHFMPSPTQEVYRSLVGVYTLQSLADGGQEV